VIGEIVVNADISLGSIVTFAAALLGAGVAKRASGRADVAAKKADVAAVKTTEVHDIVNGQRGALVARTQQLEQALVAAKLPIPPDPYVEPMLKEIS
jgi:hypothetical protein